MAEKTMAAITAPNKPIRFNVQPPFLSKAAKSRSRFRRFFTNRLPPPENSFLPEG
jgi:hypothetical protein